MTNALHRSVLLGIAAARANIVPAVLLWSVALGLVLAYYNSLVVRDFFQVIAGWKASYGFAYSAVSTAIFGGLLPLIFQSLFASTRKQAEWRHLVFFCFFGRSKGSKLTFSTVHWVG